MFEFETSGNNNDRGDGNEDEELDTSITCTSSLTETTRKRSASEMDDLDTEHDLSSPAALFGESKVRGKKKIFPAIPGIANLAKRVELLEAHPASPPPPRRTSSAVSCSRSSSSTELSPHQANMSIAGLFGPSSPSSSLAIQHHFSEASSYTTTFRPISSLRGT